MARITDLSVELIGRILELCDWSTHLQLALSCRHLAYYSHGILGHHRKCHNLYKASSDITPNTLFDLVRALLYDPIAISHVLALEFWTERLTWDDWTPIALQQPERTEEGNEKLETSMDISQDVALVLEQRDLNAVERLMQTRLNLDGEQSRHWRTKMEGGDDGALKGMLVALCPNLEAVRLVKYKKLENQGSEDNGENETLDMYHDSCLKFLSLAIAAQVEENSWSPGFASVSRVAVGVPSRAAPTENEFQIWPTQTLLLFRLPNLRSIYLNGISVTEEDEERFEQDNVIFNDTLSAGSSPNLWELVIEDANLGTYGQSSCDLLETMIDASRGLRHVAFQNGDIASFDFDRIIPNMESKIRSFLLYGDIAVQGYRSEMFYPDEVWLPPVCTVDVSDIMLCAPWTQGKGGPGNGLDPDVDMVGRWGTSRSQLAEYISNAYGDAFIYDAIVLVGDPNEEEADMIDEALASLVWNHDSDNEGENDEDDQVDFDNNNNDTNEETMEGIAPDEESEIEAENEEHKSDCEEDDVCGAIYLEGIDGTSLQTKRWYTKTIEAGRKAGIPVHTRTTPAPREHRLPFPWPASDKELQTSPFYGHPDVDRYLLKPHAGLVMDQCDNCGSCPACLNVMSAESWAKVHEEEHKIDETNAAA